MGVMLSAGGALRWYRDVLCDGEKIAAELRGVDPYEIITDTASTARPGAGGLVFLPYLMGERTPHNDAAARGALVGLTARTTKADISRAVLEGITFGLADSLDLMREIDPGARCRRDPPHRRRREEPRSGGSSWPTCSTPTSSSPPRPRARRSAPRCSAAVAAGGFASVEEAADALVHVTGRLRPEPAAAARYREIHAVYRALYGDLRERLRALARFDS